MDVRWEVGGAVPGDAVVALYASNGWSAYTSDPDRLLRALAGSSRVVTAWDGDRLVGLARIVSDGESVAYLQDVLVVPELHGRGLGRRLVDLAFEPYARVRQHVLLTDGTAAQRAFYTALGFTAVAEHAPPLSAWVRFVPRAAAG